MSKKIFIMFLAVFMMIFAVSSAMGADTYGYTLAGSDKYEPDEPTAYDTNPTEGYAGSTYTATFSKPEVFLWVYSSEYAEDDSEWAEAKSNDLANYTLSWSISPDINGLSVIESTDASGDILVLSGTLSDDVGTHDFGFVVKVASLTNTGTIDLSGAVGTSFNFSTSETLDILSGDKAYSFMGSAGPEEDPADPEGYSTNTETGYIGGNYKAVYTRPALVLWEYRKDYADDNTEWINLNEKISFDIAWTLSPDIDGLTLTASSDDISGDILILSGTLPSSADTYTSDILATVTNVKNTTYKDLVEGKNYLFTEIVTVDVTEDTDHTETITPDSGDFSSYVVPDDNVTVTSVDENYSVVVNAPKNALNVYQAFIQSDDTYTINLPEWLKITSVTYAEESDLGTDMSISDFDATPIKSITITFNSVTGLKNGTEGSVSVPFYDKEGNYGAVVTWNVTYVGTEEPDRPFGISGDKEVSFSFTEAGSQSQDVIYYGFDNASLTSLTNDLQPNVVLSFAKTDGTDDTGKITITATVPSDAVSGDYETSFTIYDTANTVKSADIAVKISVNLSSDSSGGGSSNFTLMANPTTLELVAGGESKTASLSISDNRAVSYDVTAADGLSVSIPSGGSLVYISAESSITAGTKTVTITATDANGKTAQATITVTVTASSGGETPGGSEEDDNKFTLSADVASFDLAAIDTMNLTVTANKTVISWDWAISGDEDGFIVEYVSSDVSADFTVTTNGAAAGEYSLIISALDSSMASADITFTLTVAASSTDVLIISADPTSLDFVVDGDPQTVKLTANKTVISWDIGYDDEFTVEITESDDTSATATVTPGSSAFEGLITFYALDEDGTQTSTDITVTVAEAASSTDVFTISADPTTLDFVVDGDPQTVKLTANKTVTSWSAGNDDDFTVEITESDDTSATATVTPGSYAFEGLITFYAYDEDGTSTSTDITVTVNEEEESALTLSTTTSRLNVIAGGDAVTARITASGNYEGTLSWATKFDTGLSARLSATTGSYVNVSVSALNSATEGTKTVTVTATDEAGTSADITLTVNVAASGGGYTPPSTSPDQTASSVEKATVETPSSTARENIAKADVQAKVVKSIASLYPNLPATVNIKEVPSTSTGTQKTLAEIGITSPDLVNFKYIVLNTLSFDADGVYYFKVPTTSSIVAGAKIFMELYKPSADTLASVSEKKIVLAAEETKSAALFNDSWDVITEVPSDLNVNSAAYMQANTEYYPVVKIASGDVATLGSSGAGCNAGFGSLFGILAAAFTASSLYLRKKGN